MGKTKPRGKYQGVTLPSAFIKEIKEHIIQDNKYKSIAEFIRESVREKITREHFFSPPPNRNDNTLHTVEEVKLQEKVNKLKLELKEEKENIDKKLNTIIELLKKKKENNHFRG
jgi:type I site-specific restriction endonuclease